MRQFINKKGSKTTFIESLQEKNYEIQEMLSILQSVSKITHEQDQIIEDEIQLALKRTQGLPYLVAAKL